MGSDDFDGAGYASVGIVLDNDEARYCDQTACADMSHVLVSKFVRL